MGTGPGGPNLEDGLAWAAQHDFHFLDFNADHGANALATWGEPRIRAVRAICEQLRSALLPLEAHSAAAGASACGARFVGSAQEPRRAGGIPQV